jgi:hypothetical protein
MSWEESYREFNMSPSLKADEDWFPGGLILWPDNPKELRSSWEASEYSSSQQIPATFMEPEDSLSLKSPWANSRVNVELMSEASETQSPSSEIYVISVLLALYIYRKKNLVGQIFREEFIVYFNSESFTICIPYRVHKSPQLVPILCQKNLVHTLLQFVFRFCFNIILPSGSVKVKLS